MLINLTFSLQVKLYKLSLPVKNQEVKLVNWHHIFNLFSWKNMQFMKVMESTN